MNDYETNFIIRQLIIESCKGNFKELDNIISTLLRQDLQDVGNILSGLCGAIHELNIQRIRGHLVN